MSDVAAIVLAGGSSSRMGGIDKVWHPLAGRPVVAYALDAFESFAPIDAVVLVVTSHRKDDAAALCRDAPFRKVAAIVSGGPRRQDSARLGLAELARVAPRCARVMVHDGARPFVTESLLAVGLEALGVFGAAIPVVAIADTVKEIAGDAVARTHDRSRLRLVQTPQIFTRALLERAYAQGEDATDDALLVERLGERVVVFPGAPSNVKITTREDLVFARALLEERTRP